jgi:hypothetical protein
MLSLKAYGRLLLSTVHYLNKTYDILESACAHLISMFLQQEWLECAEPQHTQLLHSYTKTVCVTVLQNSTTA